MKNNEGLGIILYVIVIIQLVTMMNYLIFRAKKTKLLYSFLTCNVIATMWSLFAIFEKLASSKEEMWISVTLAFLPLCYFGSSLLYFYLNYTNSKIIKKKFTLPILLTISTVLYLIVLTNKFHHLFIIELYADGRKQYGFAFNILTSYTNISIISGVVFVIVYSLKRYKKVNFENIIMIVIVLNPFILYLLLLYEIIPSPGFDITQISFSVSLFLCSIAIYKYRFLDILPTAYKELVSNLNEPVIFTDDQNMVLYYNEAFKLAFKNIVKVNDTMDIVSFLEALSKNYNDLNASIENLVNTTDDVNNQNQVEFSINDPESRTYSLYKRILKNKKGLVIGKIYSFHDITNYKKLLKDLELKNYEENQLNEELAAMNEELIASNDQLKDYASTVEELAVINERNRFAMEAHDTMGRTMTLLISMIELENSKKGTPDNNLIEIMNVAKKGYAQLRYSIQGLAVMNRQWDDFVESIQKIIDEFLKSDIKIEFECKGIVRKCDEKVWEVLFKTCQESVTNAVKHGKAKNINIFVQFSDKKVRLFIIDDGFGCKGINKGFGLTAMENRVKVAGGNIIFVSDGEKGFTVNAEIPIGGMRLD